MDKSKKTVSKKLNELGYYNNVEPSNLDSTIENTFKDYKEDGVIKFPFDGLNRIFAIDAESIYEADGVHDQIKAMIPLFKNLGIDITIGKYLEEFDNDSATYSKRTIELNGKTYDASGSSDWATAFNSGFRLVDQILNDFHKEDRVFGLFMDETSMMIILNDAQFEYLNALIPEGSTYRPIDIKKMMIEH